jgi:hypothetical protein
MCGRSLLVPGQPPRQPVHDPDFDDVDDLMGIAPQVVLSKPAPAPKRPVASTTDPDDADLLGELAPPPRSAADPFETTDDRPLRIEGITPPDQSFRVRCPVCDTTVYATIAQVGQTKKCPDCYTLITIKPPSPADLSSQPASSWPEADENSPLNLEPAFEREFFDTRLILDNELADMRVGPAFEPPTGAPTPVHEWTGEMTDADPGPADVKADDAFYILAETDETKASPSGPVHRPTQPAATNPSAPSDDELRVEPEIELSGEVTKAVEFPGFAQVPWTAAESPGSWDAVPSYPVESQPAVPAEERPSGAAIDGATPARSEAAAGAAPAAPATPPTAAPQVVTADAELPPNVAGLFRSAGPWKAWIAQIGHAVVTREVILRGLLLAIVLGAAYGIMLLGLMLLGGDQFSQAGGFLVLFVAAVAGLFCAVAGTVYADGIVRLTAAPEQAEEAFAEVGIAEWGASLLSVGTSLWGASIPGWVIAMMILTTKGPVLAALIFVGVTAAFLSPPLLTSAFYTGSPFQLFSPVVFRTLRTHAVAWARLYVGIVAIVVAGCVVSSLLAVQSWLLACLVAVAQIALLTIFAAMVGTHIRHLSPALMGWDEQARQRKNP